MIVLDASAAIELLLETDVGGRVAARLRGEQIHAPAHFDTEVVGAIRRSVNHEDITDRDGLLAVSDFLDLPVRRWSLRPFVERAYELRATHSFADAVYLAVAEALDAPLLTTDLRLARSHGHSALLEVP